MYVYAGYLLTGKQITNINKLLIVRVSTTSLISSLVGSVYTEHKLDECVTGAYLKLEQGCITQCPEAFCRILSFINAFLLPNSFIASLLSVG